MILRENTFKGRAIVADSSYDVICKSELTMSLSAEWTVHLAVVDSISKLVYQFRKFILILLAVCSPIPGGLLSPSFILGAVFGRLYGYILKHLGTMIGVSLVRCKL